MTTLEKRAFTVRITWNEVKEALGKKAAELLGRPGDHEVSLQFYEITSGPYEHKTGTYNVDVTIK